MTGTHTRDSGVHCQRTVVPWSTSTVRLQSRMTSWFSPPPLPEVRFVSYGGVHPTGPDPYEEDLREGRTELTRSGRRPGTYHITVVVYDHSVEFLYFMCCLHKQLVSYGERVVNTLGGAGDLRPPPGRPTPKSDVSRQTRDGPLTGTEKR